MILVRFGGPGEKLQFSLLKEGAEKVDVPAFYLGQTEVTREQFRIVTGTSPSSRTASPTTMPCP